MVEFSEEQNMFDIFENALDMTIKAYGEGVKTIAVPIDEYNLIKKACLDHFAGSMVGVMKLLLKVTL